MSPSDFCHLGRDLAVLDLSTIKKLQEIPASKAEEIRSDKERSESLKHNFCNTANITGTISYYRHLNTRYHFTKWVILTLLLQSPTYQRVCHFPKKYNRRECVHLLKRHTGLKICAYTIVFRSWIWHSATGGFIDIINLSFACCTLVQTLHTYRHFTQGNYTELEV